MRVSILTAFAVLLFACGAAGNERAQARGAVEASAAAIRVADGACAQIAKERRDIELARRCAHAYDIARASAVVAATAVDHWEDSTTARSSVACAARGIIDGLSDISREIERVGAPVPPIVADALVLAPALGLCPDDVPSPVRGQ